MLRFQLHAARTLVALLATLSFVTIFAGAGLEARQDDDVAEVVAELKKSRDDADEELIEKLGEMGTREAMEGLVEGSTPGSASGAGVKRDSGGVPQSTIGLLAEQDGSLARMQSMTHR